MREYIKNRLVNYNDSEILIKACVIFENLIVNNGFGLASELDKDLWKEKQLEAKWSIELAQDLVSLRGTDVESEIINILVIEIKEELLFGNIHHIAYIKLYRTISETDFCPRISVSIGYM